MASVSPPSANRRPTAGQPPAFRREFAEPVGNINCSTTSIMISNSRMRLAKGFFLPFIAAEYVNYCRRAPSGRHPAANRPPTGNRRLAVRGISWVVQNTLSTAPDGNATLPHYHTATLPNYHRATLPHYFTITLPLCHSATLPLFLTTTLSHCQCRTLSL